MRLLVLAVVCGLCSCSSYPKPELVPVITRVPAPVIIPDIQRPILTIDLLTKEAKQSDSEIAKAYLTSIIQLEQYSRTLEIIVESIREQNNRQFDKTIETD